MMASLSHLMVVSGIPTEYTSTEKAMISMEVIMMIITENIFLVKDGIISITVIMMMRTTSMTMKKKKVIMNIMMMMIY